ncbi:MAG: CPBP family intramembrane glutamic endopeptidase [Saprospiraceae bacterium]
MQFYIFDHIVALVFGIIIPILSLNSGKPDAEVISELPPKKHLFYTNGLMLIIGSLLALTAWNFSNRPWAGMGFRQSEISTGVLILIGTVAIVYLLDLGYGYADKAYQKKKLNEISYMVPLNWSEYAHFIFMAIAAGVCEEIIFRGFLVTYTYHFVGELPNGVFLASLIPAIAFGFSHMHQGFWAVLKVSVIGLLLGLIFIESKSLILVVIAHISIDLISGLFTVINARDGSEGVNN